MTSRLSAAALRTLILDTPTELDTYNSSELPDGATVYLNDIKALYRLDKFAGTAFDALIGDGYVVKPDDQTAARWLLESSEGSSPYFQSSYLVSPLAVTLTQSAWAYLGNVAGSFAVSAGSGAAFTIDNATGEVTYHGPQRTVLVTATATIQNTSSATRVVVQSCLSRNSDVVAGSTGNYEVKGQQQASIVDVPYEMTVQRIVSLSQGTTLRLAFKNVTNGDDLSVVFYQLAITPL